VRQQKPPKHYSRERRRQFCAAAAPLRGTPGPAAGGSGEGSAPYERGPPLTHSESAQLGGKRRCGYRCSLHAWHYLMCYVVVTKRPQQGARALAAEPDHELVRPAPNIDLMRVAAALHAPNHSAHLGPTGLFNSDALTTDKGSSPRSARVWDAGVSPDLSRAQHQAGHNPP
jgi:hypothetical protein